jgi:hypothetical protein
MKVLPFKCRTEEQRAHEMHEIKKKLMLAN